MTWICYITFVLSLLSEWIPFKTTERIFFRPYLIGRPIQILAELEQKTTAALLFSFTSDYECVKKSFCYHTRILTASLSHKILLFFHFYFKYQGPARQISIWASYWPVRDHIYTGREYDRNTLLSVTFMSKYLADQDD